MAYRTAYIDETNPQSTSVELRDAAHPITRSVTICVMSPDAFVECEEETSVVLNIVTRSQEVNTGALLELDFAAAGALLRGLMRLMKPDAREVPS